MATLTIQERVLALHGEPFATEQAQQELISSRALGEPIRFPQTTCGDALIDGLAERAVSIVEQTARAIVAEEPRDIRIAAREQAINALIDEVRLLPHDRLIAFEARMVDRILERMIDAVSALPTFLQVTDTEVRYSILQNAKVPNQVLLQGVNYLNMYHEAMPRSSAVAAIFANLEHDVLGKIGLMVDTIEIASDGPGHITDDRLRETLEDQKHFVLQVLRATSRLARCEVVIVPSDPTDAIVTACIPNAQRFGVGLLLNGQQMIEAQDQNASIHVNVAPATVMYADSDTLGLMIYNLVKNSLKLAKAANLSTANLHIDVGPSLDGKCVEIFVRDDGIGVSHDKLRKYFTARALKRREAGATLSFVEECLLNELWAPHVPPVALATLLLDRGASADGGTGIGLAVCREIIRDEHQGFLQLYQHPTRGAGVRILLPSVDASAAPADRARITMETLTASFAA